MYTADARYVWYNKGMMIVLMYFINGVPFTFEEVIELGPLASYNKSDLDCMRLADNEKRYESDDVFKGASYLISENAHPCFDNIEISNVEILPNDICDMK